MIGIIGYQDDVIGFGLAGVCVLKELKKSTPAKQVLNTVHELTKNNKIILINETLMNKIRGHRSLKGVLFIEIPEDKTRTNIDEIERLTRETLGIKFDLNK